MYPNLFWWRHKLIYILHGLMVSNCQQSLIFGWTFLLRKHSVSLSLGPAAGVKRNFAQPLRRCLNKKVEILYYCVCTLTFTFLTVVCFIKWVDLAHFCQVPFICQSSPRTVQTVRVERCLLLDLFLSVAQVSHHLMPSLEKACLVATVLC